VPTPTRAEASDVAGAIYDGADAVMLSAESATGSYPTETVAMMDPIIEKTEKHKLYRPILEATEPGVDATPSHAVAAAAASVAASIGAPVIVPFVGAAARMHGIRVWITRAKHPLLPGPWKNLTRLDLFAHKGANGISPHSSSIIAARGSEGVVQRPEVELAFGRICA